MEENKRIGLRYAAALLVFTLLASVIIRLAHRDNYYVLISNIQRTDGLKVNSRVMLSGFEIGHVKGMTLREDYTVDVRIRIKDWVRIPNDSATAIFSESLLGGKYLAILPGGSMEYMQDGDSFYYSQNAINLLRIISAGVEAMGRRGE